MTLKMDKFFRDVAERSSFLDVKLVWRCCECCLPLEDRINHVEYLQQIIFDLDTVISFPIRDEKWSAIFHAIFKVSPRKHIYDDSLEIYELSGIAPPLITVQHLGENVWNIIKESLSKNR